MTEQHGEEQYTKCSQCKCRYLNNAFHILKEYGYDRLDRRYKTCKKCKRTRPAAKPSRDLTKNIPSLDLQTLGLPDNVVDTIMNFHGEIEGILPIDVYESGWYQTHEFDKLKKYIRKDNWSLKLETSGGRGGSFGRHYVIINIDESMVGDLVNDEISIEYSYPTKYGSMESKGLITSYNNDSVQIGKYFLKLDKFKYITIKRCYNFICYQSTDD